MLFEPSNVGSELANIDIGADLIKSDGEPMQSFVTSSDGSLVTRTACLRSKLQRRNSFAPPAWLLAVPR